jgi:hypothetical protein
MLKWLRQQSKYFYAVGFDALVKQRDKCLNVGCYAEKCMFFYQFRMSHVLRYIYIYIYIYDIYTRAPFP